MTFNTKTATKIAISVFLFVIIFTPSFSEKAHAQFVSGAASCVAGGLAEGFAIDKLVGLSGEAPDAGDAADAISGAVSGGTNVPVVDQELISAQKDTTDVQESFRTDFRLKEYILDCTAQALAQEALQTMTEDIVSWVNQPVDGGGTGAKFVTQYQQYFTSEVDEATETFLQQANNTLPDGVRSDVVGALAQGRNADEMDALAQEFPEEYDGFQEGDFSAGGWDAYRAHNETNPFEKYSQASQILNERQDAARTKARGVYQAGNGFINVETCPDGARGPAGNCLNPKISTPGTLIENQVNQVLGSGVRELEAADELNEVVRIFFEDLFNEVFSEIGGGLNNALNEIESGSPESDSGNTTNLFAARAVLVDSIDQTISDLEDEVTLIEQQQLEDFRTRAENADDIDELETIRDEFETYLENTDFGAATSTPNGSESPEPGSSPPDGSTPPPAPPSPES